MYRQLSGTQFGDMDKQAIVTTPV